jgi:hypothetical protein
LPAAPGATSAIVSLGKIIVSSQLGGDASAAEAGI